MLRLMLLLGLSFAVAGCDAFDSSHERFDSQERTANIVPHHDGDHGGSSGDEDSGGSEGNTGGEDRDTGGCETEPDVPPCDVVDALAVFKTHVQPSIDKACHSCHAFAAGGLTMVKEEDDAAVVAQNRLNLKASAESASAEKLFLKISNQSSAGHGGGDQSDPEKGNLTLAKIEAWLAVEVNCD